MKVKWMLLLKMLEKYFKKVFQNEKDYNYDRLQKRIKKIIMI